MIEDEKAFARFKEHILKDGPRMGLNDKFQFRCHPEVSCFNRCCHDVNIFLTPYDIIRLKKKLGMTSGDLLDRHCIIPFSKEMRFPVVLLKMSGEGKGCPFLKEPGGCSVYEDRPWSCRMYPIGRAAASEEAGGEQASFYFLLKEEFCEGHRETHEWTVAEWMDNQGVTEYDAMGRIFQDLAQEKRFAEMDLKPEQMDMLFMATYDLDKFRRFVTGTKFLKMFDLSDERVEAIKKDDVELMKLGYAWIRFAFWKDKTLKIRDDIVKARLAQTGLKP